MWNIVASLACCQIKVSPASHILMTASHSSRFKNEKGRGRGEGGGDWNRNVGFSCMGFFGQGGWLDRAAEREGKRRGVLFLMPCQRVGHILAKEGEGGQGERKRTILVICFTSCQFRISYQGERQRESKQYSGSFSFFFTPYQPHRLYVRREREGERGGERVLAFKVMFVEYVTLERWGELKIEREGIGF